MIDLFNYRRRESSPVQVGNIQLGGDAPIRIQSMTTTNTNDTEACVAQAERIIKAGGELVRLTTQGRREAENLKNINAQLRADGFQTPLVADVHFNANVADVAALYAEKVRVNPGNYVDPARVFKKIEYTDAEYAEELKKLEDRFVPFLNICREHHRSHRRQPRLALRPHHVALRRHARGHRRELHGVSAHLQEGTFRQCRDFN